MKKEDTSEFITVLYGPSGVGKTALLRAVAEQIWSIHIELPGPDWHTKDGGSKSAAVFFRLLQETTTLTDANHVVASMFLAKCLTLLLLHATERVKSPHDWLNAQLNGYDSFIQGMHFS